MFKLITPPTSEVCSLTEIKQHLRLISSPSGDRTPVVTIQPGQYSPAEEDPGTVTGDWVDVTGYNSYVEVQSILNEATGTLDLIIQESNDKTEISTFYTFAQITTDNDGKFYTADYTGGKQFIRVVGTVTNAACNFGVNIILDSPVCSEDTWLDETRQMVREEAEKYQGRSFFLTEWELILDHWPWNHKQHCHDNFIEIEKSPIQAPDGNNYPIVIKYKDIDGIEHTLGSDIYYLDLDQFWPRICLKYGEVWPSDILQESGAIRVSFTAGYKTIADFKAENKNTHRWMLTAIKKLYDDRNLTIEEISHKALDWGRVRGYF